jgi:hypothetical protein
MSELVEGSWHRVLVMGAALLLVVTGCSSEDTVGVAAGPGSTGVSVTTETTASTTFEVATSLPTTTLSSTALVDVSTSSIPVELVDLTGVEGVEGLVDCLAAVLPDDAELDAVPEPLASDAVAGCTRDAEFGAEFERSLREQFGNEIDEAGYVCLRGQYRSLSVEEADAIGRGALNPGSDAAEAGGQVVAKMFAACGLDG